MFTGSYCAPTGAIVYCQPQSTESDAIGVTIDACAAAYERAGEPFPDLYDIRAKDGRLSFNTLEQDDYGRCDRTLIQIERGPLAGLSSYDPATRTGRLIPLSILTEQEA